MFQEVVSALCRLAGLSGPLGGWGRHWVWSLELLRQPCRDELGWGVEEDTRDRLAEDPTPR